MAFTAEDVSTMKQADAKVARLRMDLALRDLEALLGWSRHSGTLHPEIHGLYALAKLVSASLDEKIGGGGRT